MRIYSVNKGDEFKEYKPQRFMDEHREEVIESWLEKNPEIIVEDGGLLIIGRQVTTNLNTSIDLLGIDREGNVATVELKRDKTPRDNVVFEAGFFMHAKRKERTLIIREEGAKMPADVGGNIYLPLKDRHDISPIVSKLMKFMQDRL